MDEQLRYLIALSMAPSVGSITARKLIAYTGSPSAVFSSRQEKLRRIPGIGDILSTRAGTPGLLEAADREIKFCLKNRISMLSYRDEAYPARLKHCPDAPLVLFCRGENVLHSPKMISIVGTRRATDYGIFRCRSLIREISERHPETVIVSGLAYGIDFQAHQSALKYGLKTVAVMAHGLHTVYPGQHRSLALKITRQGCLVSDFPSGMQPERNNFLKRNRIIAGLSDAVIVAESAKKGGALITANLAVSYNRDVFAIPGRANDEMSAGCNLLIKNNKAGLLEDCSDLEYFMGWDNARSGKLPRQGILFTDLTGEEERIATILEKEGKLSIDDLCLRLDLPVQKISPLLLNLEFQGVLSVLPGSFYRLNK